MALFGIVLEVWPLDSYTPCLLPEETRNQFWWMKGYGFSRKEHKLMLKSACKASEAAAHLFRALVC